MTQDALLHMTDIHKTFGGVPALRGAHLHVGRGEVHALIGQNGAGKSTLLKILTGAYRKDHGEVHFGGRPADFATPKRAQEAGIATIYQEVNLVRLQTVSENVLLGHEPRRFGLIDWRATHARTRELLGGIGVNVDVTRPLEHYSIAVQQMVAIARALALNARLVVMDEPTSSLDDREVETLFRVIRQLRDAGVSVIFVSHRLDELYSICSHITVMRDGLTVYQGPLPQLSKLQLVSSMLGRNAQEVVREGQTGFARTERGAETVLDAARLHREPRVQGVDLQVRRKEVVGLAGLLGSGRTETARTLFAAEPPRSGEVHFKGRRVHWRTPHDAIRDGVAFCGEDRKHDGIIPDWSVRENLTLALLPRLTRAGIVNRAEQQRVVETFAGRLGVRCASFEQPIRELSGGNQQKVLLARWLCMNPDLLILDEPTRGIDVGAKAEIQRLISELAEDGLGVLMISSDLEELIEGCHRVTVLRDGRPVQHLSEGELSEDNMLAAMAHDAADGGRAHAGHH
ncbi:sugar ABC transporter ATP-binding protein [Deinococcus maricopensis]|uniref:Monosaccharide-transporting ATPase n=1 Tax=Deinococcus maricopensis (strain DSM 21211 / LMG 22137 / NRRL B-23946 / LB-34) TaxID=709986 RepID=E8U480_DEIML|nr:sugar ABC transporter ATP-binding protein [Deinococcus maricopensis]ADV65917.1 Monosaccharide-transporting ATPase [Deinococcus maricopensis DSM 21211]